MKRAEKAELIRKARQGARERALQDPEKRPEILANLAAERLVVDDLVRIGYCIETLDDLRYQESPWKSALPVLLDWLIKTDNLDIKHTIIRKLSVPWLRGSGTALLIEEFRKYASVADPPGPWKMLSEQQQKARYSHLLAWALGNALSLVSIKGFESQIIGLCRNPAFGSARQMMVAGLARLRMPEAENTALELLDDETVRLHAIIALGKMRSKTALPRLDTFLKDPRAIVRKEARKAINKATK